MLNIHERVVAAFEMRVKAASKEAAALALVERGIEGA
jgi:hypothetical protein